MHAFTLSLVTLIGSVAVIALVQVLISLLFSYACVYVGDVPIGYLIPRKSGSLVLYNNLMPVIRHQIGNVDNLGNIQLMCRNGSTNHVPIDFGHYNTNHLGPSVIDTNGHTVANITNNHHRKELAVDQDGNIVSHASASIRGKSTIIDRHSLANIGADIGALYQSEDKQYEKVSDEYTGIGDLILPAAYIFLIVYMGLLLIFAGINSYVLFATVMFATYLIILLILSIIKHFVVIGNSDMQWTLFVDDNVGSLWVNIMVLSTATVLAFTASNNWKPALVIVIIAVGYNMMYFRHRRNIKDPYQGWNGSWRHHRFDPPVMPTVSLNRKTFYWRKILENKGVKYDPTCDKVTIQLHKDDFESDSPRVRKCNLYYNPGINSEDQRDEFTRRVLIGVDKYLKDNNQTDIYEDYALGMIVRSAFDVCKRHNLADFEMFDLLLQFCQQNIEYKFDEECDEINNAREYFRFASETLYDGRGDCDCKAVLGYKLFELLGVRPLFVIAKSGGSENYNHAALVLLNDAKARVQLPPNYKEYAPSKGVYCEATSDGSFHPGDIPKDIDISTIRVIGQT